MKKGLLIAIAFALVVTGGLYAQAQPQAQTWAKSYNRDGQINLYASVGYWWGLCASVTGEYVIGEFNAGGIPLDYGIQVVGIYENYTWYTYSVNYWGAAPMFAIHLGLKGTPIEFMVAAGLGFYGYMTNEPSLMSQGFGGVGFATNETVTWFFSDNMGVMVQYAYVGATSIWGVGIRIGF